MLTKSTANAN